MRALILAALLCPQDPEAVKEKRGEELEKFGVTAGQVNRAIDRGAAFLAAKLLKYDSWQDEDYLACYALIHTNLYHTHAKLRAKIDAFLRDDRWLKAHARVYLAGLRAMALEATKDPELRALARECAEYLVESQGPEGTWTYSAKVEVKVQPPPKAEEAPGLSVSGGEPLDEAPKGVEIAKRGDAKDVRDGDTSCTQFALLGLHAAAKCGFTAPKDVWRKCLEEMEKRACKDGGWHYHGARPDSYGSMTCAGVCSIALCRYYLGEKDYLDHPQLKSGLKWLADNFAVDRNPKEDQWPLYYLYSVERVGVFAGTETIGSHRWYPLGAKHLVDIQKPDGSWKPGHEDVHVSTALALLFLTRATAPVSVLKRGGKGWLESHTLNDAQNFMFILDASGSMLQEMEGKEKFEVAREVVEQVVKKLPEGTQVGLRVYGHRYKAIDEKAETDSELVIPVGPLNLPQFMARLRSLKCRGKTPITYSLEQTARDLMRVDPEVEIVAILLTDGGESTRGAKPPEAAAKLRESRKGLKVHVVGFDIGDDDWRAQLEATAASGGGRYFHALKASDLYTGLALATVGAGDYVVADRDGKEVLKGKLGDRQELPEGRYTFTTTIDGRTESKVLWINTEVTSHVTVNLSRFLKK